MPRRSHQPVSSGDALPKVRKLADMVTALQDGSQSYFYITRLTSIKSLCRTGDLARVRFTLILAQLTLARHEGRPAAKHRLGDGRSTAGRGLLPDPCQ